MSYAGGHPMTGLARPARSRPKTIRRVSSRAGACVVFGLACLLGPLPGMGAQERPDRIRRLTVEDGLRHEAVYSLRQDRVGFLWFATEGGLTRYDGSQFVHFPARPFTEHTPSSQDASYVHEDADGVLWIGTWGGGVERLDPREDRFLHLRHDPDDATSLSDDRIHTVHHDSAGRVWVSTFRGLNRFVPGEEGGSFVRYRHDPDDPGSLAHDRVWGVSEGPDGDLWVATDRGLDRLDASTGRFDHHRHDPEDPGTLPSDALRTVVHDRGGTLWIGTSHGLASRGADGTIRRWPRAAGELESPDDPINTVFEDSVGQLWVGTMRGGLGRLDRSTGGWTWWRHDPSDAWSLPHDDVRSLWEDRAGVLWIATRGGGIGLLELEASPFRLWTADSGSRAALPDPSVLSVLEEADGTLWIGTLGGLARIRGEDDIRHFTFGPPGTRAMVNDQIQAILRDSRGVLWVATYGGLYRYAEEADAFERLPVDSDDPNALATERIQVLLEDSAGRLWVGTRGGLHRYRRETDDFARSVRDPDDPRTLADDFVWSLFEDSTGGLWIGTDVGGVHRMDPDSGELRRFPHDPDDSDSLSNGRVRAIVETPDGQIWVGTRLGLNRLDPETGEAVHYFEEDGLPNASIHGVVVDDVGFLWLATNDGLARFDPRTERVLRFGEADGLQGRIFNRGAFHRGPSGQIYFGGTRGLNAFDPAGVGDRDRAPAVVLTSLDVRNRRRLAPLRLPFVTSLELEAQDTSLALEFVALDSSRRVRPEYSYRLEGFDDDWIVAGPERRAAYTNLPPGEYRFRVRLSTRDGSWQEPALDLRIDLPPPWWATWWFRAGAFGLVGVLLWGGHRLRVRRIRRDRQRLEALVRERTAEVEEQRAHLASLNEIVQLLNRPLELERLLGSLLEGVSRLGEADQALLYRQREPGDEVRLRAAVGEGSASAPEILVSAEEASGVDGFLQLDRRILEDATRLGRDTWVGVARDDRLGVPAGREIVVMRIPVEQSVVAWAVVVGSENVGFSTRDLETLADLHEPLRTAFVKVHLLQELRELDQKKNEFLGIAAHDLRSPLGGIVGYADLLKRLLHQGRLDVQTGGRFLETIGTTARQMLDHVSRLLDVAAIESGRLDVELEPGRLDELLRERRSVHAAWAASKEIEVELELPRGEPIVLMDRGRVGEVVDNLLSNAIKFTSPGGRVRLVSEVGEKEVTTRIQDDGPGLDREELEQAFTGKKLGPRPTAGEPSSGLGLVIVKKIVDLHGGRVWVESRKGQGCVFSFTLPRPPDGPDEVRPVA